MGTQIRVIEQITSTDSYGNLWHSFLILWKVKAKEVAMVNLVF